MPISIVLFSCLLLSIDAEANVSLRGVLGNTPTQSLSQGNSGPLRYPSWIYSWGSSLYQPQFQTSGSLSANLVSSGASGSQYIPQSQSSGYAATNPSTGQTTRNIASPTTNRVSGLSGSAGLPTPINTGPLTVPHVAGEGSLSFSNFQSSDSRSNKGSGALSTSASQTSVTPAFERSSPTANPANPASRLAGSQLPITPSQYTTSTASQTSDVLFIPSIASSTTNPTGAAASSSARALQSSIAVILPNIQSYIDNPGDDTSTTAINAIKGVLPIAKSLSDSIGPGSSSKSCSLSLNLISDIFNAVKCAVQNMEKVVSDIEGGIDDIENLRSDIKNLSDLEKPLDDEQEEDDDQNSSENQSQASTSHSSGTSSSTTSTSSSLSSSSSGSCLFPPAFTLPLDSLTGPPQPSQPTSIVVVTPSMYISSASSTSATLTLNTPASTVSSTVSTSTQLTTSLASSTSTTPTTATPAAAALTTTPVAPAPVPSISSLPPEPLPPIPGNSAKPLPASLEPNNHPEATDAADAGWVASGDCC